MPINHDDFRAALSRFASGVTVVTTKDNEDRFHGITVSAFCSVSLEPPMILVCIEKSTGSYKALEESSEFVVNILSSRQSDLSELFASQASNKFDRIEYRSGINGVPVLDGALVNLECKLTYSHDGGDHSIFVGSVENVSIRDGDPLVYFHGNYRVLTN